jgi:hypothetical protein
VTEKPKTRRVADPELQAMSKVAGILADLEESVRVRVMKWMVARYPACLLETHPEETK